MPRPPRIDFPGARHHVMSRGARRQDIFLDDGCCVRFLELLAVLPARFGIEVHGYALMPNHFHLMLVSTRGRLSLGMSYLLSRYARELNAQRGWDGPLFRGRFHHRLVTEDAHWVHLLAYLHLNPLRAGLVRRLSDSRWTSHGAYAGVEQRPEWLHVEELLASHGQEQGYWQYVRGVRVGRIEPPAGFAEVNLAVGPALLRRATPPEEPPPPRPVVAPQEALRQVAEVTGVKVAELSETRRGREGNPARVLAAYWLVYGAGLTAVAAGQWLGMHPVRVSQAVRRVRERRGEKGELGGWVAELEGILNG